MAKAKKKNREFKMLLKYKGTKKTLLEGEGPGVLVTQEVGYKLTDEERKSGMFSIELMNQAQAFMEEHMEVVVEEIRTTKKRK